MARRHVARRVPITQQPRAAVSMEKRVPIIGRQPCFLKKTKKAEISELQKEVSDLQNFVEELNKVHGGNVGKIDSKRKTNKSTKEVLDDPIDIQRRDKVKEAMLHAWSSYEKYAWGQDELQVW
ncbi:mannosyl-oligosaccharide 1,2-alpha-mannosidase [Trifolium repens]|nr:mannosyl-oligosaccharide 1,2-alpha-mannosidase [Trifolium repens]